MDIAQKVNNCIIALYCLRYVHCEIEVPLTAVSK
jgi:hypothetical protein